MYSTAQSTVFMYFLVQSTVSWPDKILMVELFAPCKVNFQSLDFREELLIRFSQVSNLDPLHVHFRFPAQLSLRLLPKFLNSNSRSSRCLPPFPRSTGEHKHTNWKWLMLAACLVESSCSIRIRRAVMVWRAWAKKLTWPACASMCDSARVAFAFEESMWPFWNWPSKSVWFLKESWSCDASFSSRFRFRLCPVHCST